jgi:hypothetical protein
LLQEKKGKKRKETGRKGKKRKDNEIEFRLVKRRRSGLIEAD